MKHRALRHIAVWHNYPNSKLLLKWFYVPNKEGRKKDELKQPPWHNRYLSESCIKYLHVKENLYNTGLWSISLKLEEKKPVGFLHF